MRDDRAVTAGEAAVTEGARIATQSDDNSVRSFPEIRARLLFSGFLPLLPILVCVCMGCFEGKDRPERVETERNVNIVRDNSETITQPTLNSSRAQIPQDSAKSRSRSRFPNLPQSVGYSVPPRR